MCLGGQPRFGYSYDANRSMVSRELGSGACQVRYDGMRRPVRVAQGGSLIWRAAYDADGVRRKRVDAKGTIHYLSGCERNVGTGQDTTETRTKYYRALGRLIAFRRNGTLYWVGTDHLGSTARVANVSFSPISQVRYLPCAGNRRRVEGASSSRLTPTTSIALAILTNCVGIQCRWLSLNHPRGCRIASIQFLLDHPTAVRMISAHNIH